MMLEFCIKPLTLMSRIFIFKAQYPLGHLQSWNLLHVHVSFSQSQYNRVAKMSQIFSTVYMYMYMYMYVELVILNLRTMYSVKPS